MKFIELTVHTTTEGSELVADVLWQYTTYGVAVSDANDVIALQRDKSTYWDYIDDEAAPQGDVLVKCFLLAAGADADCASIREELDALRARSAGVFELGTLETGRREVEGDEWMDIWKKHFRPLHIGERVVVCPEWIPYEAKENEAVILLDSNMAFGTGEHETTAMCLELLQKYLREGDFAVDVGCGSGILGIAAVKLGAKGAYLSDIDPFAVASASHNAARNGVADRCTVVRGDLLEEKSVCGQILTANITADILCRLAPGLPAHLAAGGTLILSGIIESKLDQVLRAFEGAGMRLAEQMRRGEWFALAMQRA